MKSLEGKKSERGGRGGESHIAELRIEEKNNRKGADDTFTRGGVRRSREE